MKVPRFLAGWLAGLATAALLGALAGALILFAGLYDIRANSQHSRLVSWAVHKTMIHSVRRRARPADGDFRIDGAMAIAGARAYERHCISCHGGPGVARARRASAMLPTPPFLIDASRRWSRAELYALVHNGVKMTAMPAWGEIESDREIRNIVAFLEVMPRLTPDQYASVRAYLRAHRAATDTSHASR